ncbi:MAG: Uma2 family endonuclease [Microcoleaceae cyanobacterium]
MDIAYPPCNLESQEPPLETELHLRQIILLIHMLEYLWQDRQDFYAFGNLTIYYSLNQKKSEEFRGPDFFVVLNTERKTRKSWTVWEEGGKYPNVIIELLSDSTQTVDRGEKKQIYQDVFRLPEYFWFSPDTLEFQGLELLGGEYQDIQPNENGWMWSKQLELFLGVHEGKLRFFTPEGEMAPTAQEAAKLSEQKARAEKQQRAIAEQKAQAAEQQLETAEQQNERLKAKLREMGVDPDTI